jgi:hypothetical protein
MNLLHRKTFAWLAALSMSVPAWAAFFDEWPRGVPLFSEADLKPCEDLWAKHLAFEIERWQTGVQEWGAGGKKAGKFPAGLEAARKELERTRGLSPLEFARQASWKVAATDLQTARKDLKSIDEQFSALGSEQAMMRTYGVVYSGRDLDARVTHGLTWRCTYNVRLAQLTNKPASTPAGKGGAVSIGSSTTRVR